MTFETPDWLTKEFIKHALEDGKEKDIITVEDIEVDKPIAKGDNYMCEIFRVKVAYRTSGKDEPLATSLIVKSPIVSIMLETLLKMGLLQKEVLVYNEYIPKVNDIIGSVNSITPKSFYSDQENVLVLEDLKFEGYVMADRQKQLDFEHCVVALKTLALYHAVSVKLHEQEPEFVEKIGKEVFFTDAAKFMDQDFASFNFKFMAEESKNRPELKRYTETFQKLGETAAATINKIADPKYSTFNVMNHGDFWVNNMLFQFDNGKPVSLKLVDFQVARYTTPAIDLLYFLYGSVQEDVRVNQTDDLLRVYVEELNANLQKFGLSQRLAESELKQAINLSEFYGLYVSLSLFPVVTADPKKCVLDMKDMKEEDFKDFPNNPFSEIFRSKKFIEVLVKRLGEFENKGVFVI